MPHPFRVFLRNGWEANEIPVYTICENVLSLIGKLPRPFEHIQKHRPRQFPCIGVLQRGMVAGDKMKPVLQFIFTAMPKGKCRRSAPRGLSNARAMRKQAVERNLAQADHNPQIPQQRGLQIGLLVALRQVEKI